MLHVCKIDFARTAASTDAPSNIGIFYKRTYHRIFISNPWVKSIACDWTGSPPLLPRTTLCDPFFVPFPLLARLLRERETRVKDIESWQESKETIRAKETRLSCQKEMKTELSVTERRLHGSNSFRFSVQPLSVQRFPSTFLILSLPPLPKSFDLTCCSPAPHATYEVRAKEKILKKKERVKKTL